METLIKSLFDKDIDRDIKGVIKVGQADDENIKQELEEYVVTEELKMHMESFFESYKKGILGSTDKNGVWISGFFGSGKSHFLKILSYLLDKKTIDGKTAISYFDNKGLDNFTLANMKLAEDITTDVVLFNIDSKSDSDSKANKDAIVNVFNKVFNQMQGFCGNLPWLADLERQMTKEGVYEKYKESYKRITGAEWEDSRSDFYYKQDAIVSALCEATDMSQESARNWYIKSEENYSLSVESFAKKVLEYCESKGKNHHVLFMVDEMGQYIGDDSKLMLNLQTVVEDLGTYCNGRCWVVVTSQEGIDEITKNIKGNDFSKIQGRFNTRLSLSSANVDEVIKKRILKKTEGANSYLKALYSEKESIIKNLLTFTTDTAEMKLYKNSDDFAEVYPFIPYQFGLLQKAFNGVREHGVSGKSLSRGERSLLGAFQQVAVDYMDRNTSVLIPFSAFYVTIETFLDSSVRSVIMNAEKNERLQSLDIEVLKLLFLIKYVKEIKGNIENLSTLLVNNIDASKKQIKDNIQESLTRLVREVLVQKNVDEYVFLTNDEQDVNKEIKNIQIDSGEVIQKVGEIIFEDIYRDSKYSYSKRYMFNFNKVIDDRGRGPQTNDIGVKIITENYNLISGTSSSELKQLSIRENNVVVNISKDTDYIEEIDNVLKIDSYLRLKSGIKASAAIEDIKIKKGKERDDRLKRAKELIEEALKYSEIYVNGQLLELKDKSGVEKINEGLRTMIEAKYNKLNYIKDFIDSQKELFDIMDKKINQMSLVDVDANKLAMDDMLSHIQLNSSRNLQVTARSLLTRHKNQPYGWNDLDIYGIIITLFKKQEIKAIYNNEVLSPNNREIVNLVSKRDRQERVIIKVREKVNKKYIEALKEISKDLFNISSLPGDEDGMVTQFKGYCENELRLINEMLRNYTPQKSYPEEKVLKNGKEALQKIIGISDTLEFFKKVSDSEDDLLNYVDNVDNIKAFFFRKEGGRIDFMKEGDQKKIFDNAHTTLKNYEDNKDFISSSDISELIKNIKDIIRKEKPYNDIKNIPLFVEAYNNKITELLDEKCKSVMEYIEECKKETLKEINEPEKYPQLMNKVMEKFSRLNKRAEGAGDFSVLAATKELASTARDNLIKEIRNVIVQLPVNPVPPVDGPVPRKKQVRISNLISNRRVIKNEKDIQELLKSIGEKLNIELEEDVIITIIE